MTSNTRRWHALAASAATLLGAACSDLSPTGDDGDALASAALGAAFASAPVGYGDLSGSFVGAGAAGFDGSSLWVGGGRGASFARNSMMGGGLRDEFVGIVGSGRGYHGPFGGGIGCGGAGTFDAATGRVVCPVETRNGLTLTRSASYASAAGAVQQAFDTLTTNTVNLQSTVTGTVVFDSTADGRGLGGRRGHGPHGGGHGPACWGNGRGNVGRLLGDTATIVAATTTVNGASSRTVAGLAQGGTQRTVNGASSATETTTGTSSRGAFTATRVVGDTTRGLVVPVRAASDTARTAHPTAGTVIRVIRATLTYTGQAPATLSRREVVTYDGTATASVAITENGTTRNCTRTLPRGALTCQ